MAQSGPLRVHAASNGSTVCRVGFSIPRAVGGAVVRNRLRRRLRAILAPRLGRLAGLDLIVAATPPAAALDHSALAGHLVEAVERAVARVAAAERSGGDDVVAPARYAGSMGRVASPAPVTA
jgi:ribonuclease P protein component